MMETEIWTSTAFSLISLLDQLHLPRGTRPRETEGVNIQLHSHAFTLFSLT